MFWANIVMSSCPWRYCGVHNDSSLVTSNPLADACRQYEIVTTRLGRHIGNWDLIHGGWWLL